MCIPDQLLFTKKQLSEAPNSEAPSLRLRRGDLAAESWSEVKEGLAQAKQLCDKGGDWERKNRLKVCHTSRPVQCPLRQLEPLTLAVL